MTIPSLPAELLCSIFLELYSSITSDTPSRYLPYRGKYRYELLNLLLVCRAWHSLILDSPLLWTSLLVETDDQYRWIKTATACLDRNKTFPLDITIAAVGANTLKSAMDMILPHVDRWRSLALIGSRRDLQLQLENLDGLEFPRLISLTLHPSAFDPWGEHSLPYNTVTPSLQHLSFGGLPLSLISSTNPPRCLTSLDLWDCRLSTTETSRIVSKFAGTLEVLHIERSWGVAHLNFLALPNLTHLTLSGNSCVDILATFGSMPKLQHLRLVQSRSAAHVSLPIFPQVRVLEWVDGSMGMDHSFTQIIRSCPNITTFSCMSDGLLLGGPYVVGDSRTRVLEPLLDVKTQTGLPKQCPDLEVVRLDCIDLPSVEELLRVRPLLRRVETRELEGHDETDLMPDTSPVHAKIITVGFS